MIISIIIGLIAVMLFISSIKSLSNEYSNSGVWTLSTSIFMGIYLFIKHIGTSDSYDDYDDY